jgi:hypothetical protein
MSRATVTAAFALATLIATSAADAQLAPPSAPMPPRQCVKRIDLLAHLSQKFREQPVHVGLTDDGYVLEVFASIQGETWTVAVTMPTGVTCLVATGQEWQTLPRVAELGPPA